MTPFLLHQGSEDLLLCWVLCGRDEKWGESHVFAAVRDVPVDGSQPAAPAALPTPGSWVHPRSSLGARDALGQHSQPQPGAGLVVCAEWERQMPASPVGREWSDAGAEQVLQK